MKLLAIFLIFLAGCVHSQPDLAEIKKRLKNRNLDEIRRSQPVDNEKMTRLLKVDYWFRTESVIYDLMENKETSPSTIMAGNYSFETLHHDTDGGMLGRFSLTLCKTDNCGTPSPVYVAFRQGGNNILEVLTSDESPATWNFLYALINTIYTPAEYGEGDIQTLDTIYGNCRVSFGRPEDKRFRRIINNCHVGDALNFSRIDGLENVEYNQDVWYTQNTKVDADIVMIDAIEYLGIKSRFHEKYGIQLESRTHIEITNRTRLYIERYCDQEMESARCAEHAFGARKVGGRLYENVRIASIQSNRLHVAIDNYRNHLHDMGDTHICEKHSQFYAIILQEARFANREQWREVIRNPENDHVLAIIANSLGSVGSVESLSIAREMLLLEAPDHFDDLLFGIAHSTQITDKWQKQLIYWLVELKEKGEKEEYWKLANTIATVLRRKCEQSTSTWNSCNKGKSLIVKKFINDLTAEGIHVQVLQVLENLPIFETYNLAKKLICSEESMDIQKAALRLILTSNKKLYDSQLVQKLIRVFRNTCPLETSTSCSQIAADILLKCIPEHQNVATLILRTESLLPEDQEKWNYLYKAIEASGEKDELKQEVWRRMRNFRVFRPNYLQRSLSADSHSHWTQIADAAGFRIFSQSSAEFVEQSFKRSDFEVTLKQRRKEEGLFSLSIDSKNLDRFVTKNHHAAREGAPEAHVRLGIFGHLLPSYNLFKGSGDLLSAVWEADGRTIKAFEGHIAIRDSRFAIPLLSGMHADLSSKGSVSSRLQASSDVSIWNQKSGSMVESFTSGSLSVSAVVNFHNAPIRRIDSSITAVSSFSTQTDILFHDLPYYFCLKTQQSAVEISQKTSIETIAKPRRKQTFERKRSLPGITYRLDDSLTQKCNSYLKESKNI